MVKAANTTTPLPITPIRSYSSPPRMPKMDNLVSDLILDWQSLEEIANASSNSYVSSIVGALNSVIEVRDKDTVGETIANDTLRPLW